MTFFIVKEHEPLSLEQWFEEFKLERIDMEPTFQRRAGLWSEWKKSHLIDSILNKYDIPKIYLADFTELHSSLNTKKRRYAIIDGKQRLGAIFEFFEDGFPLHESFVLDDSPDLKLGGLRYSELHPDVAVIFEKFVPVVMSVVTDDETKITEMFTRLNSGESANSAERRNAIPGPATDLIRKITNHQFFSDRISFTTVRMQEFNLAAKLALIEFRGELGDVKAKNLDSFANAGAVNFVAGYLRRSKYLNEQERAGLLERYERSYQKIIQVLDDLTEIFGRRDQLLGSQGHIPVYYWLMRNNRDLCLAKLRPLLVNFTERVRQNLVLSREDADAADPELMSYYTMSRTTNDQKSLSGRYEILLKHLNNF